MLLFQAHTVNVMGSLFIAVDNPETDHNERVTDTVFTIDEEGILEFNETGCRYPGFRKENIRVRLRAIEEGDGVDRDEASAGGIPENEPEETVAPRVLTYVERDDPRWPDVPKATRCVGSTGSGWPA